MITSSQNQDKLTTELKQGLGKNPSIFCWHLPFDFQTGHQDES